MSERVTMPALGESVTEGTVTRWLKNLGDTVEVDEPLLEVSTDKVDTEIPSPVAGTLQEILAQEDETVAVGADLAVVGEGAAPGSSDSGSSEQDGSEPEQDEPQDDGQSEAQGDSAAASTADPDSAQDDSTSSASDSDDGRDSDDAGDTGSAQANTRDSGSDDAGSDASPDSAGSDSAGSGDEGSDSSGTTVTMPALGESVTEGTVTRWLKAEGDQVEVDEPLLEVSTDKVDTEIPSPVAGKLTKILVGEDETVPVGGDLAVVGGSADSSGSTSSSSTSSGAGSSGSGSSGAAEPATTQPESAESTTTSASAGSATAGSTPAGPDDSASRPESDTEPAAEQGGSSASEERDQQKSSHRDGSGQAPPAPSREPSDQSGNGAAGAAAAGAESGSGSGSGATDASAYVTPLVRKLAAQHDVDLSSLTGTGVGGRIRKQDVLDAADADAQAAQAASSAAPEREPAQPAAASAPASGASHAAFAALSAKRGTTEKMSRLRSLIARRMVESLQVSAQLTTVVEVDVTKVARLRARSKADFEAREGTKLSFLPFFALAAIEALKAHPNVNASVEGDTIVYHASENLGIAVDTEKGLIVPVIKDAGGLNIAGLARKIADLAQRTRTNKVSPDELGGGTFTLTNTGSRGALFDTPIINQPQVAILGTGAVVKRPVVVTDVDGGETIAIRSMVYLALSYDHRIVDGADAARFLNAMKVRLEEATFEV